MKEKRNYKRFELIPFLAILGCGGMLLFECVFIFELYDRAVEQSASPARAIETPEAAPVAVEIPAVSAPPAEVPVAPVVPAQTNAPSSTNSASAPRESTEPAIVPVG